MKSLHFNYKLIQEITPVRQIIDQGYIKPAVLTQEQKSLTYQLKQQETKNPIQNILQKLQVNYYNHVPRLKNEDFRVSFPHKLTISKQSTHIQQPQNTHTKKTPMKYHKNQSIHTPERAEMIKHMDMNKLNVLQAVK